MVTKGPRPVLLRWAAGEREEVLTLALISVAVGLVLAVGYHLFSMRFQVWASKRRATMTPAIVLLGFIVRLFLIGIILVVLGLWSPLNIIAVCVAFVVVFTLLTAYSLYAFAKRKSTPPQAGAGGTS